MTAPRAFISHASDDKTRFVIPFASVLRANGVDAWVDQWEIQPGDSIVQRIFDEGIAEADAFIVVLSTTSVTKPWVRDELDAGVVKRINSRGEQRLIPVVLDAEVEVPAALRHLRWESVPDSGIEGVAHRVVNALHGHSSKPPLGAPPAYASTRLQWTATAADETVFRLIVDQVRELDSPGLMLFTNDVQQRAAAQGLGAPDFYESMHALTESMLINAQMMAGGQRWLIRGFPNHVWLALEQERGVDLDALRSQLLADIVNQNLHTIDPRDYAQSARTIGALLGELQGQRLLTSHAVLNGTFSISNVSPLARRAL